MLWRLQRSSQICSKGTPRMGTRHFGMVSVRGRNRVPCPAASKKAFIEWHHCAHLRPFFTRPRSATGILVGVARRASRFERPAHSAASVFVDEGIVSYDPGSMSIELKGHFMNAELSHGFTNAGLMFLLTIKEQKAAAAGTGNLAPK